MQHLEPCPRHIRYGGPPLTASGPVDPPRKGPILNVYLLGLGLSPTEYVGTRAMFFCIINVVKMPLRVADGTLVPAMARPAALLATIAVAGVAVAQPVLRAFRADIFAALELSVVGLAGCRLIYTGMYR